MEIKLLKSSTFDEATNLWIPTAFQWCAGQYVAANWIVFRIVSWFLGWLLDHMLIEDTANIPRPAIHIEVETGI